jgi:hypothetical protein
MNAPDEKRPLPPRDRRTEGISSKTGIVRHFFRHEGLAPVRLSKGSTPDRAFKRAYFCRTSDRSPCLFSRSSFPGLMTGDPRTARFPHVRANQARGRQVGANGVQASAIEMAPALHLLHETGGTEMKTEGTRNNRVRISNAYAAVPP